MVGCVADTTPPVLECLASAQVELGTSETLTTGATDLSGTPDIKCPDTATLAVGPDHVVICKAMDASGNEATCDVAVTVTGASK